MKVAVLACSGSIQEETVIHAYDGDAVVVLQQNGTRGRGKASRNDHDKVSVPMPEARSAKDRLRFPNTDVSIARDHVHAGDVMHIEDRRKRSISCGDYGEAEA